MGDTLMRVAVLGLGQMGAPIADRVAQAGHELSVWNRSPGSVAAFAERGIATLARPADAFSRADVVITMLADGAALEAVTLADGGVLEAGGGTLIDMSTVSAATSAKVAEACEARGTSFLRAPVTGNPSVVVAGNLGIIASGPRAAFDRAEPLLKQIGRSVFYVGAAEQARIVKLALNLMIAGTAELMAEALVLTEKHGIARADMLEVMGGSAVGSPFVKYKAAALIADDYASTFTTRLMYKDLTLVEEAAHDVTAPLPLAAMMRPLVEGCIALGMGDDDFMALLPRLRREAGL